MSDIERERDHYRSQCDELKRRMGQLVQEQSHAWRDAMRCRMISFLMREAQQLTGFNVSLDELDDRYLKIILATLDVDRAAVLKYSTDKGYFLVQAASGFPQGSYPGFTPPSKPLEFCFANRETPSDPMIDCLRTAAGVSHFLWAFNPRIETAILLANAEEGEIGFSQEDRTLAEGALNVLSGLAGRKRAEDVLRTTQERLELALQGADLGMWDWNVKTGDVIHNTRWANMLGYTVDEVDSNIKTWEQMLHPDDKHPTLRFLQDHLEGTTPVYEAEYRLRTKGGAWKWILDKGQVVEWDLDGKPLRATGTHLDITERKQAETKLTQTLGQLENSHSDLMSILNGLYVGTALFDEEGCITFLSRAGQEYTGLRPEEVLNRPWEKVLPFQERHLAKLREMIQLPKEDRQRISINRETAEGRQYFMDLEVMDDPRDPRKKILSLYDTSEVQSLRQLLDEKARYQELIGKSKSMRLVFEQIQQLCKVDTTVLIEGETGTGKELVARALHYSSPRKEKPFVAVNCSGLTDSVLHSQLFGHRKGAFTGAVSDHPGVFDAAGGGTVFLDEISGVSMSVQSSLLRVLEEREITPLGTSRPKKINIRILVATNQDLSKEVANNRFRRDLFYRIRVARILLPPLNQRREDIPLLARSFLRTSRTTIGKEIEDITPDAMQALFEYSWPGNVRELKNAIEYAVIRCKQTRIYPEYLPPEIYEQETHREASRAAVKDSEKARILAELKIAGGNRSAAARQLGISRATLYRRLSNLNINPKQL